MKKIISLSLLLSFLAFGCGTDDTPVISNDNPKQEIEEYFECNGSRIEGAEFSKKFIEINGTDSALQVNFDWLGTKIPFGVVELSYDYTDFLCKWELEEGDIVPDWLGLCDDGQNDKSIGIWGVHEPTSSAFKANRDSTYTYCRFKKNQDTWYLEFKDVILYIHAFDKSYVSSGRIKWEE